MNKNRAVWVLGTAAVTAALVGVASLALNTPKVFPGMIVGFVVAGLLTWLGLRRVR